MRTRGACTAALLLLATLVLQVSTVEDIYWEGEDGEENEFLEVKENGPFSHLSRLKRDFSDWLNPFNFGVKPTTTTAAPENYEAITEDEDDTLDTNDYENHADGSGAMPPNMAETIDPGEKTLRVSFVVMEPFLDDYSNRDSKHFQTFSHNLANAVNALFDGLPGVQKTNLVRIQSRPADSFSCKVTLDIQTTVVNTDKIIDLLRVHLRNNRSLGMYSLTETGFSANVVNPGSPFEKCQTDELQCSDGRCVTGSALCDGIRDCSDGADERDCPPYEPEQRSDDSINEDVTLRCANPIPCASSAVTICPEQSCDGVVDCPGGEDEDLTQCASRIGPERGDQPLQTTSAANINPETTTQQVLPDVDNKAVCTPGEHLCDANRCIESRRICDELVDCLDRSDEANCNEKRGDQPLKTTSSAIDSETTTQQVLPDVDNGESCTRDDFVCSNNKCIESFKRCNRIYDCPNGEDEFNCECTSDEFRCSDGACIESRKRCDSTKNCQDGSDEMDCGCSRSQWQCDNGHCVNKTNRCNGPVDCPLDMSDERNCIANGYFKCQKGKIIPEIMRCDGQYDCLPEDRSDEQNCPCGEADFKCDNGNCIHGYKRCDRKNDCQDGSDEINCKYGTECMAYEYKCTSGECVHAESLCNGTVECQDGSDESKCPCMRGQFRCRDGSCINMVLRCNGQNDCRQGEDELNCMSCPQFTLSCPAGSRVRCATRCNGIKDCDNGEDEDDCHEYECVIECDGRCLDAGMICDGSPDCKDGSDESQCENCDGPNDFRCDDGFCVQQYERCNGIFECPDESDEQHCNVTMPATREDCVGQFMCRDGTCVNNEFVCDSRRDCYDGSDELNCPCQKDEFQCENYQCISNTLKCDGVSHCYDGSDEYEDICKVSPDNGYTTEYSYSAPTPNPVFTTTSREAYNSGSGGSRPSYSPYAPRTERPQTDDDIPSNGDRNDIDNPATTQAPDGPYNPYDRPGSYNPYAPGSDLNQGYPDTDNQPGGSTSGQGGQPGYPGSSGDQYGNENAYPGLPVQGNYPYPGSPVQGSQFSNNNGGGNEIFGNNLNGSSTAQPSYPSYPTYPGSSNTGSGSGSVRGASMACKSFEWRCENGPCIDGRQRCDGHIDCPFDFSDEFDCPPGSPITLNLKQYPEDQTVRSVNFGGDVVFICRDEGPLRAPVRWVREGSRPFKPGTTDKGGRLEMFQVTLSDSGIYICQAPKYLGQPGSEIRASLVVNRSETFVTRSSFIACKPYEATCGNGECISKSAVCDGKVDCSDRSDEDMCNENGMCEPSEFQCENRKCVLKSWLCDSDDDCGDGSDEKICPAADPHAPCLPMEFACADPKQAQCVPKSFHCDGRNDCFDGSDELGCRLLSLQASCLFLKFACCNCRTQCVKKSFHCDGRRDCFDGSDEVGCSPVHVTIPPTPANVKLNPGETLTLKCEAVGVPVPIISWRLNWGHVPAKCTWTNIKGVGILTCPNMQPEDNGAYSCEAINNKATTFATPDAIVSVSQTNPCPNGYFNNEARSQSECIRCFCFGKSTRCQSADLFTYNMPTPLGEGGTRLIGVALSGDGQVRTDPSIIHHYYFQSIRNGAIVTKLESHDPNWLGNFHPFLTLPESYNGNQLTSYGGHIKYTVYPHTYAVQEDEVPAIIVKGKYATLYHVPRNDIASREYVIEARFVPEYWEKSGPNGYLIPASREDIMMALDAVDMIMLRADNNNAGVNITNFVMESAQNLNSGLGAASLVEECSCPEGYEGLSCQKCKPGYVRENSGPWLGPCVRKACLPGTYGDPSNGVACKPCPCPLTNKDNQFATTCSLGSDGSVRCDCFSGYEGKTCEKCAAGFVGNPLEVGDRCRVKPQQSCNQIGIKNNQLLDECECKENVEGRYCDQCKNNSFYLSKDFSNGCARCFCSGQSEQCMSSNLRRKTTEISFNVPTIVDQLKVYNTQLQGSDSFRYTAPVETSLKPTLTRRGLSLSGLNRSQPTVYYWSMPASFAGDKVTAYGGYLRYTLGNFPSYVDSRQRNTAADVQLISENHLPYLYFGNFPPSYEGILNVSIQMLENGWQRSDGKEVPREMFLLALADVKTILIKATYSTDAISTPIRASIETAASDGNGPAALHVEQCVCPAGYIGTSCEDCAPGYTRGIGGLYLADCEVCQCNGHSRNCHPETGQCYECMDNTYGPHCEFCKEGYESNGYDVCTLIVDTSTIIPCRCDPRGEAEPCDDDGSCTCKRYVDGETCDRCRAGTFGLDAANPDGCTPCYCSGATADCQEANHYYREAVPAPILGDRYGGYTIMDINAETIINEQFMPVPDKSELMYVFTFPADMELYWSLPVFPGNRILSYGGSLSLRQEFKSNDYNMESEQGNDVILIGDDVSVSWYNPNTLRSGEALSYQVPLREEGWTLLNTDVPASRSDFMRVLKNLRRVLVKATLAKNIVSTSIADVSMDTATDKYQPNAQVAKGIEMCMCPPGHLGTSCETCAAGYYKNEQDFCEPCSCHGHDCQLDTYGQVVCNCRPPYTGHDCSAIGGGLPQVTTHRPPMPQSTVTVRIINPAITIQEVGSSVNFTCEAQSPYSRRLVLSWVKVDGNLPQGRSFIDQYSGVLRINNLQISDSGQYICQTSDGRSTGQASVTLKVPASQMEIPTVEIRPPVVEYYVGDRIELECVATGSPKPTISWQRASGRPLPMSAENYEELLIIDSVREEDSGEYRCIAVNTVGSADRIAVINVRARPSRPPRDRLVVKPAAPTVDEGQSTRVVCTGSVNVPAGTIDWVRQDGDRFQSNVRSDNGVLYIAEARPENAGVYVCQTHGSEVDPEPVLLTVVSTATPSPDLLPEVSVPVKNLRIPSGGSDKVDCFPHGQPLPRIKWIKYEGEFGRGVSQRGDTLYFSQAEDSDSGYYVCQGIDRVHNHVVNDVYVYIEIEKREKPVVEVWPKGENPVALGNTQFEFHCRVLAGIPEPVITWSRAGGRTLSPHVQIKPNNILQFDQIEVNDEGEYICSGDNEVGSSSASAVVRVRSPPEITITPTLYLELYAGDPITLDCRADGYPEPWVTIQSPDRRELASKSRIASLRVPAASARDDGEYVCVATNAAGTIEEKFVIRVDSRGDGGYDFGGSGDVDIEPFPQNPESEPRPHDPTKLKEITIIAGEKLQLHCDLNEGMLPQWTRGDSQPLKSTVQLYKNQLIIYNISESDAGVYVCNSYNPKTGVIRVALYTNIKVIGTTKITLHPPTQTVQPGYSPTVECVVEGADIIDITWRPTNKPFSSRVKVRNATLLFEQIEVEDAGLYECVARSRWANSSATAEVIVVAESDLASRESHDHEQWVRAGAGVVLSCNVSGEGVTVRWTKDGSRVPTSVRTNRDGSLLIKLAQSSHSGHYVCHIRDLHGRQTSNYINLHIEGIECLDTEFRCHADGSCISEELVCDDFEDCGDRSDEENCLLRDKRYLHSAGAPEASLVRIDQPRRAFRIGENVKILCKSASRDIAMEWIKRDEKGTRQYVDFNTYGDGSMLMINGVSVHDAGVYQCFGRNRFGQNYTDNFVLDILPGSELSNTRERNVPVREYTAGLRKAVDMPCNHDLEEPVSIQWRREYSALPTDARSNQPILHIRSVTESDAGMYVCRVSNRRTTVEAKAILRVVGVIPRFDGDSWVALPTLKDAYRQFDIEISLKPTDANGMILYNSQNPGRTTDFLALQLQEGVPEFILETGSGPVSVKGDRPLALNEWHTIRLVKLGSKVTMDVDNNGPFEVETPGNWELLELQQPLYLGGVPNYDQLPANVAGADGFTGCISMLILGHEEKNIMVDLLDQYRVELCDTCAGNLCQNSGICQEARTERGYMCICDTQFAGENCERRGEACRPGLCGTGKCTDTPDGYKCACPVTHTGRNCETRQQIEYPAFTGSAYLALRPPNTYRVLKVSLKVKANAPVSDGIIMYCAESPRGIGGFTSITVRNGRLEFRYDLGDGNPVVLRSNMTLPANEWTDVQVTRSGALVSLNINLVHNYERILGTARASQNLKLETPMFFGGVDENIVLNRNTRVSSGFMGCIKDLKTYGNSVDMVNDPSVESANLRECSNFPDRGDIPEADSNPCRCTNGGSCASDGSCVCPSGFAGYYCETRFPFSPRYPSVRAPTDPCAAHPCRNGGTCRPNYSNMMNHTCDCLLGFAGASCQMRLDLYQSVGFSGNGYLELPASLVNYEELEKEPVVIALLVATVHDGVLAYQREALAAPDAGDYLLIRIERGHVVVEWDMGSGVTTLSVNSKDGKTGFVTDGEMHRIVVKLFAEGRVELTVDGVTEQGNNIGFSNNMGADSNIYIGGIPEWLNINGYGGLNGCIDQVEFMDTGRGVNLGIDAIAGRNTQPCKF